MYNGARILGIIPARGGSKGVPRKNIKNLAGKPLIAWTIEQAKQSKYLDRLILSSEDKEIAQIAEKWGCEVPFSRPDELARDETPGIEPVLHAISTLPEKYSYVVLLQPTSPLRIAADIDKCIEQCVQREAKACVTVSPVNKSPYWMYYIDDASRMIPVIKSDAVYARRQDLPNVHVINGAVYVADCEWLLEKKSFLTEETVAYKMPTERSLDIDNEIDFMLLEVMLKQQKQ